MKFLIAVYLVILGLYSSLLFALDAGEHALIGDIAFNKVNHGYPNHIKNLEMNIAYSYGHLVAMSGDMYKSVEEISLSDAGVLNGFYKRNRKGLKKCINLEIEAIRNKKVYSGCDDIDLAKKKARYVTLAHDNYTHFAWHNIKNYIRFHSKALWFARLAFLKCSGDEWEKKKAFCEANEKTLKNEVGQSGYQKKLKSKYRNFPKLFPRKKLTKRYLINMSKDKMIRLAIFTNAYADHYLTDAFSAGHLRVPRSQIDDFVESYNLENKINSSKSRKKGSSVSGALTQYLHNLDGAIDGIKVINSLGEPFIVRSDKQIFSRINSSELSGVVENNSQIKQPVLATAKSIQEVFTVIKEGVFLNENYEALNHVPFVEASGSHSLANVVNRHIEKKGSIKDVIKHMSEEMQLVFRGNILFEDDSYKTYFSAFVSQIPQMMAKLRKQITREIADPELSKRIPEKLKAALQQLN
ncbi:hypothetical protein [Aliikangiella sp. IMCC44359]|uniref:hypothetical protein n=1 Tax=Aliikangiella sp. IMCC44359 TaxID=3459125 RepID=UPI00403AA8E0